MKIESEMEVVSNVLVKEDLISVIVPVYNVEEYLNQCIKSIVYQTYWNLEIILVNDGSTDNSEILCKQWERRDSRIRVISQRNQGLASARNVGVNHCHGEYFVFIDSDDWVSRDFVSSLYHNAIKEQADIVMCNFYRVIDGKEYYCGQKVKSHVIKSAEEKTDFLLKGHACMWSKMYRRSWYQRNHFEIPRICYEDLAVFPLLIILSKKIVCIDDAIYFYRVNRNGSIMNSNKSIMDFPQALKYSIQLVRERFGSTYLDVYILLLQFINVKHMQKNVINRGISEYQAVLFYKKIVAVWNRFFENWREYLPQNLIVFGSFNTRWSVHRILLTNDGLRKYYGFTSLIAQFMGSKRRDSLEHENKFRMMMVKQDWEQDFANEICNNNADYLFIDFMEEVRNNVILTEENEYLTNSEALNEVKSNIFGVREVLYSMDEEYFSIWKQACDRFVDSVDKYYDRGKVILVKMRYASWYFENGERKAFTDQEDIRQKNRRIGSMEKYFQDRCEGICVIEIPEKYFYSDEDKYGKDAYYLNKEVYDFVMNSWFEKMMLKRDL